MREQPTTPELLDAVTEFLRGEIAPILSGRLSFHARVAANVLDIVRREILASAKAERAEAARLRALLGRDGPASDLNAELCDRISAGSIDQDDPALVDHLWATILDTVAIDQPSYATYRREAEGGTDPPADAR